MVQAWREKSEFRGHKTSARQHWRRKWVHLGFLWVVSRKVGKEPERVRHKPFQRSDLRRLESARQVADSGRFLKTLHSPTKFPDGPANVMNQVL